jgi:hypothetical protein
MAGAAPHIGMLSESPLHASLKAWYARAGDRIEVPVDGFVIDLVRGDLLIEVQTSGFSSMKAKLVSLLDAGHRVRIVHPVPVDKWIVRVDGDGTELSRRRSPKHGAPTDVFAELVSFPELVGDHLAVEVVLTVEEEVRHHAPGLAWRRKGWVVEERRLIEVVDSVLLADANDLAILVPDDLPSPFTTGDLAAALGRPLRAAQKMAYCLRNTGVIHAVGKRGRSVEYRTT